MIKFWLKLRGYKRQASAIMLFIPTLLQFLDSTFGLGLQQNAELDNALDIVTKLGMFVFGVGWFDWGVAKAGKK